jgi:hypothetical protein
MPRRPPPTSLRLIDGPLPSRSVPRHTMPSVPAPVFQPAVGGPLPREREKPHTSSNYDAPVLAVITTVPTALSLPSSSSAGISPVSGADSEHHDLRHSRSSSSLSSANSSASPSPSFRAMSPAPAKDGRSLRGPWDHSSSISFHVNVDTLLAAPAPAAVHIAVGR